MIPVKLRLKNFIGIKHGMRQDAIELDMDSLPEGIIVFDADTGTGKTTILDNLHPYRVMPYGAGKTYRPSAFSYYDHCYGDAEKEFFFQINGITYRSLIKIDVNRKKQEAYLYVVDDAREEHVVPGIDGKLDSYDKIIEDICGSPELFFTSIFRAQNAKALSDYTKGDIKQIFIELLGIDRLQEVSENARRVKQFVAGKVELLMRDRAAAREIVMKEGETRSNIESVQADISCIGGEIASYEKEVERLQGEINDCDVRINLQQKVREEKDAIEEELATKQVKYTTLSTEAEKKGLALSEKVAALEAKVKYAEERVGELPHLRGLEEEKARKTESLEKVKEEIKKVDEAITRANNALNDTLTLENQIKEKERSLDIAVQKRRQALDVAERDLKEAEKQAQYITDSGCPIDNPTCNLMKGAVAWRDRIDDLKCDVEFNKVPKSLEINLKTEIDNLKKTLPDVATLREHIKAGTDLKAAHNLDLQNIEKEIQTISKDLEDLPVAEQAEKQLPDLKKDFEAANAELTTYAVDINKELVALKEQVDELTMKVMDATDTGPDYAKQKQELVDNQACFRKEIEDARNREAGHRQHLGAMEETLKQVDKAKTDMETANAAIDYLNGEVSSYSLLEQAFGNDGIIALEIDDAGPQVSTRANDLLQVFGGRYMVRIETQAAKASGKGQSETFDIMVTDTEINEEKSIKRMSGGQRALLEESVTKAICIYNKHASGLCFDTIFTDEKDSAFDMALRKEYFQMKRRVLGVGGFKREFCITHTPDLKAMADAVIGLGEGKIEIVTN